MEDEKKAFIRTLCTISTTMASLCFVGISIIIMIYYQTNYWGWLYAVYMGLLSVSGFALTSVYALIQLYPRKKKSDGELNMLTLLFFALGWVFFAAMMLMLIKAFRPTLF